MGFTFFGQARAFLDRHAEDARVAPLRDRLAAALSRCHLPETLEVYDELLELAETLLWEGGVEGEALARLQALYREREHLLTLTGGDRRHRFVVVIPVADRPRQLEACLESLLELCRAFEYGGCRQGRYPAVRVVVADDSRDPEAVRRHGELAAHYDLQGLAVEHFHQEAQRALLDSLPEEPALEGALGSLRPADLGHKGPSRMRNLVYLHLARLAREEPRLLFLFLDSDEAFRVLRCGEEGAREVMAVNYFHHLDRIFSRHRPVVLTGKVVGDPPVAPAVMAGNFLEDVIAFLEAVGEGEAADPCRFHGALEGVEGAAYHDMADLFGFAPAARPHPYRCRLEEPHDRLAVFADFARRLDRFFDGEHPTRITCYRHRPVSGSLQPARTVYTGNYVTNAEGLRHFIPFAHLKLRMAGPVLGRLLQAELGDRFLSANLPLLHRRTLEEAGAAEFRAGVERRHQAVDLAEEFERQFFGDLVLFSVERLTGQGYPARVPGEVAVRAVVERVRSELDERYAAKQAQVAERLSELKHRLEDSGRWWNREPGAAEALATFRRFLANMEANFGEGAPARVRIADPALGARRLEQIVEAIVAYPDTRRAWESLLESLT